jgi:RimJ/RimL family protein N-acetyltransferase
VHGHLSLPAASQAVLRKLGFQQEGLLRQAVCKDGRLLDELAFGLLRHEWRGLRQAGQPSQAC